MLPNADEPTRLKVKALAEPIVVAHGVSLTRMLGTERTPRVVGARHELFAAMWRAGFSLIEIARLTDRDHTSVRSGVRKAVGADEYMANRFARRSA